MMVLLVGGVKVLVTGGGGWGVCAEVLVVHHQLQPPTVQCYTVLLCYIVYMFNSLTALLHRVRHSNLCLLGVSLVRPQQHVCWALILTLPSVMFVVLQYTGRLNDARWHLQNGSYSVPTGNKGLLDIFAIDTSPMIKRYRDEPWYNNAGACIRGLAGICGVNYCTCRHALSVVACMLRICTLALRRDCLGCACVLVAVWHVKCQQPIPSCHGHTTMILLSLCVCV